MKAARQPAPSAARRGRGRPRSFEEADVIRRVRDVFWALGFAAASVDDLSAAAGLSRPSLYNAFGGKRDLYLRVLQQARRDATRTLEARLSRAAPLAPLVTAAFQEAVDDYCSGDLGPRGCFLQATALVLAPADADVQDIFLSFLGDLRQIFLACFEARRTDLRPCANPADLAALAAMTLQSLACQARAGMPRAELLQAARAACAVICPAPEWTG